MRLLLSILLITLVGFSEEKSKLVPEISGNISSESQLFTESPKHQGQRKNAFSFSIEAELYWELEDDKSITLTPFYRYDTGDSQRSHFDLREFFWEKATDNWEVRIGFKKIFWGVTESAHLVDIINQTDAIESIDGEEKLGQPMINFTRKTDFGSFDLFLMPWFRERTFSGTKGRLRLPLEVSNHAEYEASNGRYHLDVAFRWEYSIGDFDIGLSHFYGNSRDPELFVRNNEFVPRYHLINQTGFDLQYTKEAWLWKLEAIRNTGGAENYTAAAYGFEYTFFDMKGSGKDLGLLLEHLYDSRDKDKTPIDNDLFAGFRLTFNDEQSLELLAGVVFDLDNSERAFSIEASRRLGESWKASFELRAFSNIDNDSPFNSVEKDSFFQFTLSYYF